jgi:hypothetical protein
VVVLAAYLIRVALILRRVDRKLGAVIGGLGAVVDKTQPIGPIVEEINNDLAGVDNALQGVLTKERSPMPAPWVVTMPRSSSAPSSRAPSPVTRSAGAVQTRTREPMYEPPGPDVVWGVKESASVGVLPQQFALVAGLVYVAIGVIGFFSTGFNSFTEPTGEKLLGIFAITPMHNIVHLGVGALWLLAAFVLTRPATEGANLAIGGFYVLAAVLGYLGFLDLLAISSGFGDLDFYLHLITGVVSLLFAGVLGSRDREPVDDEGVRV